MKYAVGLTDSIIYAQAIFKAEMCKLTSYTVNVKFDREFKILETECECVAGCGSKVHCKHIITVLHGLVCLHTTGKILQSQTCTYKLQTFHHPSKDYVGKPIESKDLTLSIYSATSSDPRPLKFRKLSVIKIMLPTLAINFVKTEVTSMSLLQLAQPANPYALNHDHDYDSVILINGESWAFLLTGAIGRSQTACNI